MQMYARKVCIQRYAKKEKVCKKWYTERDMQKKVCKVCNICKGMYKNTDHYAQLWARLHYSSGFSVTILQGIDCR
jgi:hypothetical protein